ncbi:MAG: hypothetical protein R3224_03055 [Balneolaceae bacterium]|nr:hypothetical protein [Balneolaceae bacterium]
MYVKNIVIVGIVTAWLIGLATRTVAQTAPASYSPGIPAEKMFEHESFFLQPMVPSPGLAGPFADLARGMTESPLLNMALNPAFITRLEEGNHLIYLDLNTTRRSDRKALPVEPCMNCLYGIEDLTLLAGDDEPRKIAVPQYSLAYLTRVSRSSNLFLGVTYQGMSTRDDYYPVPSESYRNLVQAGGADNFAADLIWSTPQNKFENMYQVGHFFSLWTGLILSERTRLGLKSAGGTFTRSGESNNFPDYPYTDIFPGPQGSVDLREQRYTYWDITGGILLTPLSRLTTGISIGYLTGEVDQLTDLSFFSNFQDGDIAIRPEWLTSSNLDLTDQSWEKDGRTLYGSVYADYMFQPKKTIMFVLQHSGTKTAFDLSGIEQFRSYYNSRFMVQDTLQTFLSQVTTSNERNGAGDGSRRQTKAGIVLRQTMGRSSTLSYGLQFSWNKQTINTSEDIRYVQDSHTQYSYGTGISDTTRISVQEGKVLRWEFTGSSVHFNLPVFLQSRISRYFSMRAGVNASVRIQEFDESVEDAVGLQLYEENGVQTVVSDFVRVRPLSSEDRFFEMPLLAGFRYHPVRTFDISVTSAPILNRNGDRFWPNRIPLAFVITVRP